MLKRALEFVYMPLFERTRKGLLDDDEMKRVEDALLQDPDLGVLMGDTGGVRKLRAAKKHRGKSGSARVVYLHQAEWETVIFLLAFDKNVQGNLTASQRKMLRHIAEMIRREEWPRRRLA